MFDLLQRNHVYLAACPHTAAGTSLVPNEFKVNHLVLSKAD